VGTAGEQPRLDDEEHAAGGGVEREHPEVTVSSATATAANPTTVMVDNAPAASIGHWLRSR